ncbi:MAG: HU family DNA-binding protein [Thermoanaerobaculia bacterium]|nr:HU family DNA-binding protein [Thermoanaerobaculia bacterium]
MAGKTDIANHVYENVEGLTKKQAKEVVDAMTEAITENLIRGDRVTLPGFGSFQVSERAARTGRNPKTGATIKIPATNNVRFKAGKNLKESVN